MLSAAPETSGLAVAELVALGVRRLRVELLDEPAEVAQRLLRRYRALVPGGG